MTSTENCVKYIDEIELEERGVMPSGEEMRKGYDFEAVYMEHKALAFLRAWPDVPEVLRPTYSRFYDAGLIFVDTNAPQGMSYPGQLRLTALGHRVREVMIGKTINFFRMVDVFALITADKLANRDPQTGHYLRLWKQYQGNKPQPDLMDWNTPDMRRYISLRLTGVDPTKTDGVKTAMTKLKAAFERRTFHTQMSSWRLSGNDAEIPF